MIKIFKLRSKIYFIYFVICFSFINCNRITDIKVVSIDLEKSTQINKSDFIKICFNQPIPENTTISINFYFKTKTNRSFKRSLDVRGENKSCKKYEAWSAFFWKGSSEKDVDFLNSHLKKGNIKTLEICIFDSKFEKCLFKEKYHNL